MSFKNFNIQDYNRIRQTIDLSRRVEEREKKEKKSNYLEKLTDERRTELMKIYGPKVKEPKKENAKLEKRVEPRTFFKRTTSLALPRKTWPLRMERNQKKNIKLQDNKMPELNIDVNKKIRMERIRYNSTVSNHRKYETYQFSEYLYVPNRDLPFGGWIQHCVFCHHETTSVVKVDDYKLYCCNRCDKKHNGYEKREICSDIIKYLSRLGY